MNDEALRDHLLRQLDGGLTFGATADLLAGWTDAQAGQRVDHHPHTAWRIVWHLRFCQDDILDFVTRPDYAEPAWPDDYWPNDDGPPDALAWTKQVAAFLGGLERARELAASDLLAVAPTGNGETVLRGLLMIVEHNAYHLGQLATLRSAIGVN